MKPEAIAYQIYKEACLVAAGANRKLRAVDLRVFNGLLTFMNQKSLSCFPGRGTLMKFIPVAETTLDRSLKILEAGGHLRSQRRWNAAKRKWNSTVYWPLIPDKTWEFIERRYENDPQRLKYLRDKMTEMGGGPPVEMNPPSPRGNGDITSDLTSDLTYFTTCADLPIGAVENSKEEKEQEKRLSEKGREIEPSLSATTSNPQWSEIYQFIRNRWGERASGFVSAAMREGIPPADVWGDLQDCIENGGDPGDLAHSLWVRAHD